MGTETILHSALYKTGVVCSRAAVVSTVTMRCEYWVPWFIASQKMRITSLSCAAVVTSYITLVGSRAQIASPSYLVRLTSQPMH
jgi:hypothetical protein